MQLAFIIDVEKAHADQRPGLILSLLFFVKWRLSGMWFFWRNEDFIIFSSFNGYCRGKCNGYAEEMWLYMPWVNKCEDK